MSQIIGVAGAIEQPPERIYIPGRGWQSARKWHGTTAAIEGLANQLAAGGYEVRLSYGPGGTATVTGQLSELDGGTPTAIDSWELFPAVVEKDILDSDIASVAGIPDDELRKLKEAINNPSSGSSPALTNPTAINLYSQMLEGLKSVRVHQPTLRRTVMVGQGYNTTANMDNIGRVIRANIFVSKEGVPSMLVPVSSFPTATNKSNVAYGWLKGFPTVSRAAYNKFQITQEWEFGLWSTLAYTHVTSL